MVNIEVPAKSVVSSATKRQTSSGCLLELLSVVASLTLTLAGLEQSAPKSSLKAQHLVPSMPVMTATKPSPVLLLSRVLRLAILRCRLSLFLLKACGAPTVMCSFRSIGWLKVANQPQASF